MAIHSSILTWRIPRMEEPGVLQSMGSERIKHNWASNTRYWWGTISIIQPILSPDTKICGYSSRLHAMLQKSPPSKPVVLHLLIQSWLVESWKQNLGLWRTDCIETISKLFYLIIITGFPFCSRFIRKEREVAKRISMMNKYLSKTEYWIFRIRIPSP